MFGSLATCWPITRLVQGREKSFPSQLGLNCLQLKIIYTPKRHILGWPILLPFTCFLNFTKKVVLMLIVPIFSQPIHCLTLKPGYSTCRSLKIVLSEGRNTLNTRSSGLFSVSILLNPTSLHRPLDLSSHARHTGVCENSNISHIIPTVLNIYRPFIFMTTQGRSYYFHIL